MVKGRMQAAVVTPSCPAHGREFHVINILKQANMEWIPGPDCFGSE
jgi:hypothetical protein